MMFGTFQDEMQYIFLYHYTEQGQVEKNFIFMVCLAVKDAGTDAFKSFL